MIGPKVAKPTPAESRRAYEAVHERSFGLCEGCGERRATEIHHRLYRSRGGRDEVTNLLDLCGWGNHTGCHGEAHTLPERQIDGWSVPSGEDPGERPVLYRGHWMKLLPDGGLEPMKGADF